MSEVPRPWYKKLWDGWMRVAKVIGNFNARVILSLFYFVLMVPIGLIVGATKDYLGIREHPTSTWKEMDGHAQSVEEGRRQF